MAFDSHARLRRREVAQERPLGKYTGFADNAGMLWAASARQPEHLISTPAVDPLNLCRS
jgi:hypothetical protein